MYTDAKLAPAPTLKRGRERKTNRQGKGTIDEICEASMKILTEEGASRLTFDRIAQVAGITKGTLIYHFPSKGVLMEYLVERYCEGLSKKLRIGCLEAEMLESPVKDPTTAGFFEWYKRFREEPASSTAYGLSIFALSARNEKMLEVMQNWYEDVFKMLKESPSGVNSVIAVLALEGLFFMRHFQVDVLEDEDVKKVLDELTRMCS